MNFSLKTIAPAAALAAILTAGGAQAATPQASAAAPQAAASQGQADTARSQKSHHGHHKHHKHRFGGRHGHMKRGGMRGGSLMHELRKLKLSDAQSDAVDAIKVKHHAEQRELFKRSRDLRRSFAALDPTAKDYVSQSGKLADQTAKIAHDSVVLRTKIASEMIATLTPQQVEQLKENRAKRQARREQHRRAPAPEAAAS